MALAKRAQAAPPAPYEPHAEQSIPLLQALHILTREGKLNQDTRRKLKQIRHLLGFIEPLLLQSQREHGESQVVDHASGKSYLGFLLYDGYFKAGLSQQLKGGVTSVETRAELVTHAKTLAKQFGFDGMRFLNAAIQETAHNSDLPQRIDIVTALHACDTASDDAIAFGLAHQVQHMVLVPCCQAEIARHLRTLKPQEPSQHPLAQLWRRPIHAREFGSQLTNVLRCLQLEAHGYQVTVTELVGWEHSLKNELILASKQSQASTARQTQYEAARVQSRAQLQALLDMAHLDVIPELRARYLSGL